MRCQIDLVTVSQLPAGFAALEGRPAGIKKKGASMG